MMMTIIQVMMMTIIQVMMLMRIRVMMMTIQQEADDDPGDDDAST